MRHYPTRLMSDYRPLRKELDLGRYVLPEKNDNDSAQAETQEPPSEPRTQHPEGVRE